MVTRVTMQNYKSVLPVSQQRVFLANKDITPVFFNTETQVFQADVMPSEDLY